MLTILQWFTIVSMLGYLACCQLPPSCSPEAGAAPKVAARRQAQPPYLQPRGRRPKKLCCSPDASRPPSGSPKAGSSQSCSPVAGMQPPNCSPEAGAAPQVAAQRQGAPQAAASRLGSPHVAAPSQLGSLPSCSPEAAQPPEWQPRDRRCHSSCSPEAGGPPS